MWVGRVHGSGREELGERGEGGGCTYAHTKMRIRCRVDPRPVNSDPAAAKWDAIIGPCVLVRRALLYSSRGCYEIIPRDSRFINMLDAHRLPFTWTMFAPVNNFIAGTESFHRVNRPPLYENVEKYLAL